MSLVDQALILLPVPALDIWGYVFLCLVAIIEAIAVIGSVFPGHTIIILAGFISGFGIMGPVQITLVAAAGAIIGDTISYWLGRKYGYDLVLKYGKKFRFNEAKFERTRELVQEHFGKTLIIGRFNSFTRAFTPFISGVSKINFTKFIFYDAIGCLSWSAISVFTGYLLALGYSTTSEYLGDAVFLLGILSLAILSFYLYKKFKQRKIKK